MRYRIHVQHDPRRNPRVVECNTEDELKVALSDPTAQWAQDKVTGEAVTLVDGALVRHETDASREKLAAQDAGQTIQ